MERVALKVPYGTEGSVERFKEGHGTLFFPEDEKSFWATDNEGVSLVHLPVDSVGSYRIENAIQMQEKGYAVISKTSDGLLLLGTVRGLHVVSKEGNNYKIKKRAR